MKDLYNRESFVTLFKTGIDTPGKAFAFINNDQSGIKGQFQKNPHGNIAVSINSRTDGTADGKLIGTVSLMRRHYTVLDVGFAFLPEYSGKGYATEAAGRILQYGLDMKENGGLVLEEAFGFTSKTNEKSIGVLKRLGIEYRDFHALEAFAVEKSAVYALKEIREDLSYYGVRGSPPIEL